MFLSFIYIGLIMLPFLKNKFIDKILFNNKLKNIKYIHLYIENNVESNNFFYENNEYNIHFYTDNLIFHLYKNIDFMKNYSINNDAINLCVNQKNINQASEQIYSFFKYLIKLEIFLM